MFTFWVGDRQILDTYSFEDIIFSFLILKIKEKVNESIKKTIMKLSVRKYDPLFMTILSVESQVYWILTKRQTSPHYTYLVQVA
jgi:hypothetical protein